MAGRSISILIASTWLALAASQAMADSSCSQLDGAKPERLVEYLQADRLALAPDCVLEAILQLGLRRHAAAAPVLARYLDFQRPGFQKKEKAIFVVRIPWVGDQFPAADALYLLGKSATQSLIGAIAEDASSDLLRANALAVLTAISREDIAGLVAQLKDASSSRPDPVAAGRLWDFAAKVANTCSAESRPRCVEALYRRSH